MQVARPLLVLLGLSSTASAQTPRPAPDVTREFQAGVDAFRLGKLDEARTHLEAARSLDPTLAGPHRFLAAVAHAQARWSDCVDASRRALTLNPRSMEIADTRKLHDECRVAGGRPLYAGELGEGGAIAVTTDVPSATVKIGGLTYGGTPLAPRPIPAGTLSVDVEKAGYKPVHREVEALPGIVTDVAIELEPVAAAPEPIAGPPARVTGWLVVRKDAGELWIDGVVRELSLNERYELPPGIHVVELRQPGRDPWRRRVRISAGQRTPVAPVLVETATREATERLGLVLVGSGGAVAAFGFAAFLVSNRASAEAREIDRVETARPAGMAIDESIEPLRTRAELEDARSRATRWALISNIAYGAALATAGVGAILMARGAAARTDVPPPFAVTPVSGGAVLSTELSW